MNRKSLWLLAALLLVGMCVTFVIYATQHSPVPMKCTIQLDYPKSRFILTDSEQIQTLLVDPMKQARVDNNPARYEVFGTLQIEFESGSRESAVLFLPLGHYKQGDMYYIADFSNLRRELNNSGIQW